MPHLALMLWLATAPLALVLPSQTPTGTAAQLGADPCAVSRQIAAQPPCLRPEECGAFEDWKNAFGAPGTEPLAPTLAQQGVTLVVRPQVPQPRLQQRLRSLHCLARVRAAQQGLGADED